MVKERLKKEISKLTEDMFIGLNLVSLVIDAEYPGCGYMVFDIVAEELDKMHKKHEHQQESAEAPAQVNEQKPANDLMETVALMGSEDYKERFKAEYYQTKIRYDKLHNMCIKYEAGTLDFTPNCELALLKEQNAAMGQYLRCLEIRAEVEGIKL